MAIVRNPLESVPDSSPDPTSSSPGLRSATLPVGPPLDFEFYALRTYGDRPPKQAIKQALADYRESVSGPRNESVSSLESVVVANLFTHPCLYADQASIAKDERIPEDWLHLVSGRAALIESVLASVGRIQVHLFKPPGFPDLGYEAGIVVGTGFVVAPGIVMTNRHVAETFARATSSRRVSWLKDERSGREPIVMVEFGGTRDEHSVSHRVERVLYMAPPSKWDVALLGIQPSTSHPLPPPLPLQTKDPGAPAWPRRVFVCGYPTSLPGELGLANLFRVLRVKRVSLGEILGEGPYGPLQRVAHSCTTLPGSSGSPVVDFENGTVWGLHFYGQAGTLGGNQAEPIWDVCTLGPVRDLLGPLAQAPAPTVAKASRVMTSQPYTRPVVFVARGDVAPEERFPGEWFRPESAEHAHVRRALQAVGRVMVENSSEPPGYEGGPGFLIAPGIFLACLARDTLSRGDSKRPLAHLSVNFAVTALAEPPQRQEVREVLYQFDNGSLSFALLRVRARTEPAPLALQTTKPARSILGEGVFVVGHPFFDNRRNDPNVVARIFPPPYGVKRLALGTVIKAPAREHVGSILAGKTNIFHDCNTLGGDAGSPLISLSSGLVLGVHIGGRYLSYNTAVAMWHILSDPELRKHIG